MSKVGIAAALPGGSGHFVVDIRVRINVPANLRRLGTALSLRADYGFKLVGCRVETINRLLQKRTALPNTSIDLFCQDLEALITELAGFTLLLLRQRWHHCEVISRVQRDRLCDCPQIALQRNRIGHG